ncbi:hypothetical protein ACNS7O_10545 [Haloferacaceae archaeon DSL9]
MGEIDGPYPTSGPPGPLVALRIGCSVALAACLIVVYRESFLAMLPLLWLPTEPLTQWASFAFVVLGSVVVLPSAVGIALANRLYARYRGDAD